MSQKPSAKEIELIHRAIQCESRTAIRDAEQSFLYRDLLDRSEKLAYRLLADSGDLNEKRVAFSVPPSFEYVVVQWAIWRAGGVAVPLSQSATDNELIHVLKDSDVDLLVTKQPELDRMNRLASSSNANVVPCEADDVHVPKAKSLPTIDSGRRALILYTSGTTSQPKGVVLTHQAIQSQIESLVEAWQWTEKDCIPLFLPLHHIHGIVNVMCCALWSGATVEVFAKFDVEMLLERVALESYSVFMAVPTIYVKLIDHLNDLSESRRYATIKGFSRMRLNVSGSAALPSSVHRSWQQLTGQRILERYGMTEIGMALSNPTTVKDEQERSVSLFPASR